MEDLKVTLEKYRIVSDQLNEINSNVNTLRNQRKGIELEMMDILKDPQFSSVNKLVLSSDGSTIKIDRNVSKAWHISKGDLYHLIKTYFHADSKPNAEGCYDYIVSRQTENLKSTDFAFTRVLAKKID
jgi:hypothetical protein